MHKVLLALLLCGYSLSYAQTFQWNDDKPAAPAATANDPLADETGLATVYPDYYEGNPTALGEVFHQDEFTAAHAKLPLGSIVEVTRLDNGRSTSVRINDRGAFCDGCVIDISKAAAQQLALTAGQQAQVKLTVTGFRKSAAPASRAVAPRSASYEMATTQTAATEPQFTAKGVSSPQPHAYQAQPSATDRRINTAPQSQATLQARTVTASYPAAASPTTASVAPSVKQQVQIITHLPAPYAVQVGSYNQFANAERHALSLLTAGFENVHILQETEIGHDPLHRVLVTPFLSLSEAEDFADEIRDYHQMRSIILHNKLVEITVD